jgi:uncharacterized membrane protein YeaQ/YmgE (transglycosylase-associated protein family)
MLLLSLCWLVVGLLIGGVAYVARLWPVRWACSGIMSWLVIGALSALVGGWLGVWVLGRLFGTAMAVWVAVLGVMVVPWLIKRFVHDIS